MTLSGRDGEKAPREELERQLSLKATAAARVADLEAVQRNLDEVDASVERQLAEARSQLGSLERTVGDFLAERSFDLELEGLARVAGRLVEQTTDGCVNCGCPPAPALPSPPQMVTLYHGTAGIHGWPMTQDGLRPGVWLTPSRTFAEDHMYWRTAYAATRGAPPIGAFVTVRISTERLEPVCAVEYIAPGGVGPEDCEVEGWRLNLGKLARALPYALLDAQGAKIRGASYASASWAGTSLDNAEKAAAGAAAKAKIWAAPPAKAR